MGLDMYVYRVSKTELDDSVVHDKSSIDGICIPKDEMKEKKHRHLLPYTKLLRLKEAHLDFGMIRHDYGIPDEVAPTSWGPSGIGFYWGSTSRKVPRSELDKYEVEVVEEYFVCECEEVCYWRKEYGIQSWLHNHLLGIVENTGYYMLSEELIKKFNKAFKTEHIPVEKPDRESALFYWEWY